MQAQGYKTKLPSLEEVLMKSSEVREAKLIGYDETPSSGTANSGRREALEDSDSDDAAKVSQLRNTSTFKAKAISRLIELPSHRKSLEVCVTQPLSNCCRSDLPTTKLSNGSSVDSNGKGMNMREF